MARIFHPPPARIQGLPLLQGLVRFSPPLLPLPTERFATQMLAVCVALFSLPAVLYAQTPPPDSTRRVVIPRPPADTDTTKAKRPPAGSIVIPGADLPIELNLRLETKTERDRNLRCN